MDLTDEEYNLQWIKSKVAFDEQRKLSLDRLSSTSTYNQTWSNFIKWVSEIPDKNIYDIGCGAGVYYELCKRHFDKFQYTGYDYAPHAIKTAKETWRYDGFVCKGYEEIDESEINPQGVLLSNALCESLTSGDKCLNRLLSFGCKTVILQRTIITNSANHFVKRHGYDIHVVSYQFNKDFFSDTVKTYGYTIKEEIQLNFGSEPSAYFDFYMVK